MLGKKQAGSHTAQVDAVVPELLQERSGNVLTREVKVSPLQQDILFHRFRRPVVEPGVQRFLGHHPTILAIEEHDPRVGLNRRFQQPPPLAVRLAGKHPDVRLGIARVRMTAWLVTLIPDCLRRVR